MLTVPLLKPGEQPFSPETHNAITSNNLQNVSENPKYAELTPEQILDHAVVKDCLTALHQAIDEQMALLAGYSGSEIADLLRDHDKFLTSELHGRKNALKNPQQQHLFETMTRDLAAAARDRAEALYRRKVHEYQAETIARQNEELLRRALDPEIVTDDAAQTVYRNMILFNLETLLRETPATEKKQRLDEASRELYAKIIDARLEYNPEAAAAMLGSSAVTRVLGDETVARYREKITAAQDRAEARRQAQEWVEEGIGPGKAKRRAAKHPEMEKELWVEYRRLLSLRREKETLTHILAVQSAWAAVKEGDYRHDAIPGWAEHQQPAVYEAVAAMLATRQANGGVCPEPDFTVLLAILNTTDRDRLWDRLREEKTVLGLIASLGGVESWAFDLASRKIVAKSTAEDKALHRDLLQADKVFAAHNDEDRNRLLAQFYHEREKTLKRLKVTELLTQEVTDILTVCAERNDRVA